MFAIEIIIENSLYSIKYNVNEEDEFKRIFNNWSDIEYLDIFFENNISDLQQEFYDNITIEEAISRTLDEAEELEYQLKRIAKEGKYNDLDNLQGFFKPLNNNELQTYPIPEYQESKLKGYYPKSWLRIYAIRIEPNVFVITGGAIKLTPTMNTREHLLLELEKLNTVKQFLIDKGFDGDESIIGYIENRND
jgi:hypothetical protein